MGQIPTYPALASLVPGDLAFVARPSESHAGSHSFDLGTALLPIAANTAAIAAETVRAEAAEAAITASVAPIGLFSQTSTHNIPTGIDRVETTGYTVLGKGAAHYILDPDQTAYSAQGTTYVLAAIAAGVSSVTAYAALAALEAHWRFQSSNGRWFTLNEALPNSDMFGTLGDGSQSFTNVLTGTVVTSQCQAFIDYCVYFKLCAGVWGNGGHRLDDTLHHGYGQGFIGGTFSSNTLSYAGNTSFGGAFFVSSKTDRPMLNIAGAREVQWSGIAWKGQYGKHITDNTLAQQASVMGALDDLLSASWIMPSISTTQDNRYAPYALVTIDAYAGTRPVAAAYAASHAYVARDIVFTGGNLYIQTSPLGGTTGASSAPTGTGAAISDGTATWRYLGVYDGAHPSNLVSYPDVAYPAWLMANTQYGKNNYSSKFPFSRCHFEGANTLVACHPCDDSNQGDFLHFYGCEFVYSKFCVSVGNDQSRNVGFDTCDFAFYFDMITNNTHGKQSGKFGGILLNCSMGAGIHLFNVSQNYATTLTFQTCYCEGQRGLGKLIPSGAADIGVVFKDCDFNFAFVNATRGQIARHLYNPFAGNYVGGTQTKGVLFQGGILKVDTIFTAYSDGVQFDGTLIYAYERASTVSPYLAHAHQASSGGIILLGLDYRRIDQNISFPLMQLDGNPAFSTVSTNRGYRNGSRVYGLPLAVKSVCAGLSNDYEEIAVPNITPFTAAKSSFTVTFSATEMTVVYAGSTQATSADLLGFGPGSLVQDSDTGTIWAVRSYVDATDTLIAVALNNYRDPGSGKVFINPVSTTVGALTFAHPRMFTPSNPVFGDTTSGAPSMANVGKSNGVGTAIQTDIAVGDYVVSPQDIDALFPAIAKVTARANGSPGSITTDLNANKTTAGLRRPFFRLPTPANV